MRMRRTGFLALAAGSLFAAGCEPGSGDITAAPPVDEGQLTADEWNGQDVFEFEGGKVDLAHGWGEVSACMVWRDAGVKECFRTDGEWQARIAEVEQAMGMPASAPDATCPSYAVLYDYSSCNSSGPKVSYHDLGCQALSSTLNNKVSSGKKNACYVFFYDGANCSSGYMAYATPGSTSSCYNFQSSINNRTSAIYMVY